MSSRRPKLVGSATAPTACTALISPCACTSLSMAMPSRHRPSSSESSNKQTVPGKMGIPWLGGGSAPSAEKASPTAIPGQCSEDRKETSWRAPRSTARSTAPTASGAKPGVSRSTTSCSPRPPPSSLRATRTAAAAPGRRGGSAVGRHSANARSRVTAAAPRARARPRSRRRRPISTGRDKAGRTTPKPCHRCSPPRSPPAPPAGCLTSVRPLEAADG
mmetsp:Transcript_123669/g.395643  ORF Transcript_123669/g.395643 Transcript_123669/m.395643 type:complete len:218 (-) Transcript_123669:130-783(-)